MDIINGFSSTLKELMNEHELTSVALSNATGISRYVILKWRNGLKNPKTSSLIKVANYFKCSIAYLCGKSKYYLNYEPKPCPPFNEWIKRVLEQNSKTSYQLFKNTCISAAQYHYWLKGAEPLLTSLETVAVYLDITLDELIGRNR